MFLGEPSDQVNSLVRAAVTQGDGTLATVVAVRLPLDLAGIAHEAAGTHYAELCATKSASGACVASPELLERFGELVGPAARERRRAGRPGAAEPRPRTAC